MILKIARSLDVISQGFFASGVMTSPYGSAIA